MTDAATRLALTRDKAKYVPGDKARVTIPSSPGARVLVGIESGSVVRESFWVECTGKQTDIEIPVKEGMAPNIYVSVTLVQPHNSTLNDAPIRLVRRDAGSTSRTPREGSPPWSRCPKR